MYMYIYVYIYVHMHINIYLHMNMCICRTEWKGGADAMRKLGSLRLGERPKRSQQTPREPKARPSEGPPCLDDQLAYSGLLLRNLIFKLLY